jgi:hypothetical protein
MASSRRFAAGTWLLEHAGVDDALVGDLAERYDRSALWYWRQALTAIAQSWTRTIVNHKWLALRAIVTGWVLWATLFIVLNTLDSSASALWALIASTLIRYGQWVVIGWVIGVLHRPYYASMVLPYAVFTIVMCVPVVSHAVTVLGHPRYDAPSASVVALAVVGLLVGGLLSATTTHKMPRVRRHTPSHSPIG